MATRIQTISVKELIICPMPSYGLFITLSTAFDEQRHVRQPSVCMCVSAFQGALWAAIRGQQEAHHCRRKENPSSGGLVEGRLERQQWVVGEVLEDSWGGKEGGFGEADPDLVESPGLVSSGCRYVMMCKHLLIDSNTKRKLLVLI